VDCDAPLFFQWALALFFLKRVLAEIREELGERIADNAGESRPVRPAASPTVA
jgi:hypothetical protein